MQEHTVITSFPGIQLSDILYSKVFVERTEIPTFSKNEEENRYYQQLFIWWKNNELTEEEMREFDGDIEEPNDLDDEPDDGSDASAFDKTALAILDAIFGEKLTLR